MQAVHDGGGGIAPYTMFWRVSFVMAKVLRTHRGEDVTYYTAGGEGYQFFVGGQNDANKGMELIKSDAHADSLLARYPDELSVVPEKDWPAKYKISMGQHIEAIKTEAAEKFPMLKDVIKPKKKDR
jgi:hypothetical protein